MLDPRRFILERRGPARHAVSDPDTGEHLGDAEESPGPWPAWPFAWLPAGWRPGLVEFREPPDGSLVFQLRRPPLRRRADVLDALDQPVGSVSPAPAGPGRWVRDAFGRPVAELAPGPAAGAWRFLDLHGRPLGEVLCRADGTRRQALVSAVGEAADQPFAKMLILAAVLEMERAAPRSRPPTMTATAPEASTHEPRPTRLHAD